MPKVFQCHENVVRPRIGFVRSVKRTLCYLPAAAAAFLAGKQFTILHVTNEG